MTISAQFDEKFAELAEHNKAFTTDGIQHTWDSTSLGLFKECPYKYYLTMIEGWRPKREAIPLTFGIGFHSALEAFDKARVAGADVPAAARAAVRKALEYAKPLAGSGDTTRTIQTLVRSVVWCIDEYRDDPCHTIVLANGKAAVELSFMFPLTQQYSLAGHIDRLVEFNGQRWVTDRKTTKSQISPEYFSRYSPDNQMSLYAFASKIAFSTPVAGVIIDAAHVAVGFTRFGRGIADRTPAQLDEWYEDTLHWIWQAEERAEARYWPMNDKSCFLCHFRDICNKDPAVRQIFLESDYERRVWDPTKPR